LAAQLPLRPDTVTVVEQWATLEDLHAHLVAPHMMEYRPRVKDLVIRTLLQVMEPV
jgi:quinol monooxygenase YgiN